MKKISLFIAILKTSLLVALVDEIKTSEQFISDTLSLRFGSEVVTYAKQTIQELNNPYLDVGSQSQIIQKIEHLFPDHVLKYYREYLLGVMPRIDKKYNLNETIQKVDAITDSHIKRSLYYQLIKTFLYYEEFSKFSNDQFLLTQLSLIDLLKKFFENGEANHKCIKRIRDVFFIIDKNHNELGVFKKRNNLIEEAVYQISYLFNIEQAVEPSIAIEFNNNSYAFQKWIHPDNGFGVEDIMKLKIDPANHIAILLFSLITNHQDLTPYNVFYFKHGNEYLLRSFDNESCFHHIDEIGVDTNKYSLSLPNYCFFWENQFCFNFLCENQIAYLKNIIADWEDSYHQLIEYLSCPFTDVYISSSYLNDLKVKIQNIQMFLHDKSQMRMIYLLFGIYPQMQLIFNFSEKYFPKAYYNGEVFHLFQSLVRNASIYNPQIDFKEGFRVLESELKNFGVK